MTTKELKNFSPQWFLKALGNGGLAVSFFMYLMFMIEHQGPMPVFSDVYRELTLFNMKSLLVGLDIIIILYFTIRFLYELQVQLSRFKAFKKTSEYQKLKGSNNEISLMTIPLTLAMGINVLFIFGAVYIPNLWNIVEYQEKQHFKDNRRGNGDIAVGAIGLLLLSWHICSKIIVGVFYGYFGRRKL